MQGETTIMTDKQFVEFNRRSGDTPRPFMEMINEAIQASLDRFDIPPLTNLVEIRGTAEIADRGTLSFTIILELTR